MQSEASGKAYKTVTMNESFQKISSFYQDPKCAEWQEKKCIFKIVSLSYQKDKTSSKVLVEKKFDMTTCMNTNGEFNLDLGNGFSIEMVLKICMACPKRDAELFKSEIRDGNKDLLNPDALLYD